MRVWLWGELFWPHIGGAELFAADLMLALRERGYEFAVVTSKDELDLPDQALYRGIPIYRFPFRTALRREQIESVALVRERLVALRRLLDPDLIHVNGITPSAFFCLNIGEPRPPLLIRLNQEPRINASGQSAGGLLEHALHRASWVTAVSRALLTKVQEMVPGITPYCSVVYNGVAAPAEAPDPPPGDPARVLCLGRLVAAKGFDLALAAFASLADRRRTRLVIAGDGPERAALQAQAAALGLGSAVEFTGLVAPEAVPALIGSAAVVAVPSHREGLPSVALQAAAMARPVVATRAGGLPEVVVDGETGLLVDPQPAALAGALRRLLAEPETSRNMGLAAWRRVREQFSPERCFDAYDALYRRLAAPRTA